LYFIVLTARTAALPFFQNPALDRESNPHAKVTMKTTERVRVSFIQHPKKSIAHHSLQFGISKPMM
jgi:hypothetical protein